MIPLLVLLALLSGCALLDRAADLTSRAFAEMTGRDTTPVRDPLYLQLQLALLSDTVVTQILQKTETPLDAIDDPNRRAALLGIRLDYAARMWNATPRRARLPRAGSSASGCCSTCSACRSCYA